MIKKFEIPVLFLVFNRLDITKQVFEEIKKVKPQKLYIASDGPRNKTEKKKTDAVREYILNNINWNCEVKTLFRKKNLGCGKAVSQAITWFFDNVEMGIILEDDCLPSQSFFPFCEKLLNKYKNNSNILQIAGFNPVSNKLKVGESYVFSYLGGIWGWATWKRAWEKYDFNLDNFEKNETQKKLNALGFNKKIIEFKLKTFKLIKKKQIDTWDYQWDFAKLYNSGLTIIPRENLIKNIGFGAGSTNNLGSGKRFLSIKLDRINFPLIHPKKIVINNQFDYLFFNFFNRSLISKVIDFFYFKFK